MNCDFQLWIIVIEIVIRQPINIQLCYAFGDRDQ